jgi:diguanylate cyclase (GGDEF)-like protein
VSSPDAARRTGHVTTASADGDEPAVPWSALLAGSVEVNARPALCLALDGTVSWANNSFAKLVHRPLRAIVGAELAAVFEPPVAQVLLGWRDELRAGQANAWTSDELVRRPDGSPMTVTMSFMALFDHTSTPRFLFGQLDEVSRDRNAALVLEQQTATLDRIAIGESLSNVLIALATTVQENRPGVYCTVLTLDKADGGRLYTAAAPGLPASFGEAIDGVRIGLRAGSCGRAAFTSHDVVTEDIERDPDWVDWRAVALDNGLRACWSVPIMASGRHGNRDKVLGTFAMYFDTSRRPTDDERRDLARAATLAAIAMERDRDEAELRRANLRDPLTGLANRRLFLEELAAALRRGRRRRSNVTVLFLDIDHFKVFNESIGHLVGDELLRIVANRVQQAVRSHDVVARFGGDEFTVSCEGIGSPTEAAELADQLRQRIEGPVALDDREVFVTVSIGIARGAGWESPHDLVAEAEAAMCQAKAGGHASVVTFDERMRAESRDRLHIRSALRRAIDKVEMYLVYQPQVDLASGQLVGVEALLRWTSDGLGSVPPAEFIPVTEDSDLIMGIGAWALQRACEQSSRWRAECGWAPVISVNASPRQFDHGDAFLDTVTAALDSSGLEPSQLRIEVTESTLGDPAATGPLVAKLKRLGVSLSIDDFGTGFSSLARLRSFPVDELKIDRSFVEGLEIHADDRAVVSAIIGMAKALHVDTVGEGVETAGQLDILRTLGCTRVQGYYLGRPMSGEGVTALLGHR